MEATPFTSVIVSYNNRADLPGLLQDLARHAPGTPAIVIDNASPDGTADLVAADFPGVRLVRNAANVGYARAVNQGIRLAATSHVFLLNPDIRIRAPQVFQDLRQCLDREPGVAVAGPLQFKEDDGRLHLNFTWSYWTPQAFRLYASHLLGKPVLHPAPLKVSFLNAGCLYMRRADYEAVGGLNEKYFLYGEEPDLFLKLIRHGLECRLVPSVSVTHAREQSLRSVPLVQRLRFRLAGGLNIADAVIRGVAHILLDRLTGRRPRPDSTH